MKIKRPIVQCVQLILNVIGSTIQYDIHIHLPYLQNLSDLSTSISLSKNVLTKQMEKENVRMPMIRRTKANNKTNEEMDIALIVSYLNDPVKGKAMRDSFAERFPGRRLLAARSYDPSQKKKAGSRSVHYDFQIQLEDGSWWNIEHKGSHTQRCISDELPPWTGGVQFFNGGMEKYRLARKYAEEWYDAYVGSGLLHREYLSSSSSISIPSKEEWILRDAKQQQDPKTPFGSALKRAVRKTGQDSLLSLRNEFVPAFTQRLTIQDKQDLIEDLLPILRSTFEQKHAWLQIAGDLSSENYSFQWSPALTIHSIHDITFTCKKDLDIMIHSDCEYPISGKLRWGKGAGFSNLRLDLK